MSIASELTALNGHIIDSYDEISTMGGTVPANKNMANMATAIASIPSGGGGGDPTVETGTVTMPLNGTAVTISHNLGEIPSFFVIQFEWDLAGAYLCETIGYCSKLGSSYFSNGSYNLYITASSTLNCQTFNSYTDGKNYITMDATTITLSADFMSKCTMQLAPGTAFWMATTKGVL